MDIEKALNGLLDKFKDNILKAIKIDYSIGSAIGIHNLKVSGKKTNMSPLNLSKKDQEVNINIISDLVKGINQDTAKKINYLTNKSITERWSHKDLAKALDGIFDKKSPNYFNYKNRMDTIARTESTRLLNVSANNTAIRLGAKKKYLFNHMDNRTGEDSKISQMKYGTEDKAIPINELFNYTYGKKQYSFMLPPDRVSDRSSVLYSFED